MTKWWLEPPTCPPKKTHASSQTWVHETPSIFGVEKNPSETTLAWSTGDEAVRQKGSDWKKKQNWQTKMALKNSFFTCFGVGIQWHNDTPTVVFQKQETYMRTSFAMLFFSLKNPPPKRTTFSTNLGLQQPPFPVAPGASINPTLYLGAFFGRWLDSFSGCVFLLVCKADGFVRKNLDKSGGHLDRLDFSWLMLSSRMQGDDWWLPDILQHSGRWTKCLDPIGLLCIQMIQKANTAWTNFHMPIYAMDCPFGYRKKTHAILQSQQVPNNKKQ